MHKMNHLLFKWTLVQIWPGNTVASLIHLTLFYLFSSVCPFNDKTAIPLTLQKISWHGTTRKVVVHFLEGIGA